VNIALVSPTVEKDPGAENPKESTHNEPNDHDDSVARLKDEKVGIHVGQQTEFESWQTQLIWHADWRASAEDKKEEQHTGHVVTSSSPSQPA
jgi:hypothetical protein